MACNAECRKQDSSHLILNSSINDNTVHNLLYHLHLAAHCLWDEEDNLPAPAMAVGEYREAVAGLHAGDFCTQDYARLFLSCIRTVCKFAFAQV